MLRICYVQVLPILSGAQRSMLEILRHLDRVRFEPAVVCQAEGPLTEELRRRRIECHLVPELGRDCRPWQDLRAYQALKRLFRRERFDIVHNQSAKPRVVATLAARHAGVPVVINHVRGYSFHEYMRRMKRALFERMEAWAARRCELRSRFAWTPDEVVVAVLGRLEDQKQPLIVPRIARRLESYHLDKPWRIAIAGDGRLRPQVEEAIARQHVAHRVQLVGWQDAPADVLAASDLVLLPSLWEGLPRVLIEAHAAGVPCVASNIRGNREVVSDQTGILVAPQSVTDYAAALTKLIEDPLRRVQLGRAARLRAERLFDSRRNNEAIVNLYETLLPRAVGAQHRQAA